MNAVLQDTNGILQALQMEPATLKNANLDSSSVAMSRALTTGGDVMVIMIAMTTQMNRTVVLHNVTHQVA